MKQYKVTLNFTVDTHEVNDFGYGSDDTESETKSKKTLAYERTEAYYSEHSLTEHIKTNDALSFVEWVISDGEVIRAEWDKTKFQIHMVVNTRQTKDELIEELRANSLEDGEYETCGETGWVIMTRGPKGEIYDGGMNFLNEDGEDDESWEYGLTDYRQNQITVELIGDVLTVPMIQELASLTEKGISFHAKMKEMKEAGVYFATEDEKVFKLLCTLIGDKRLYGSRAL